MVRQKLDLKVFFSFLLCFMTLSLNAQKKNNILFLGSYAYDWPTVPDQLSGFTSKIDSTLDVNYIFMESNKIPKDELWPILEERIILQKKNHGEFQGVVVADDNALHFVVDHRNSLFKNMFVVFMGIDDAVFAQEAYTYGNMTGLIEKHYNAENIRFALD